MKNGAEGGPPSEEGVLRQLAELDTLATEDLKARWHSLYGREPPRLNRQFLIKRLAFRIQEIAFGGLPDHVTDGMNTVLDEEGYDKIGVRIPGRKSANQASAGHPVPGTVLVREWDGERHEVTALRKGFEYRGVPYRSLSAVARKITGTRWNGPLFFGLRDGPIRSSGEEEPRGQE